MTFVEESDEVPIRLSGRTPGSTHNEAVGETARHSRKRRLAQLALSAGAAAVGAGIATRLFPAQLSSDQSVDRVVGEAKTAFRTTHSRAMLV